MYSYPANLLLLAFVFGSTQAWPTSENMMLARMLAKKAASYREAGEVVRPFLLLSEAVKLDPGSLDYRHALDGVASAKLLLQKPAIAAVLAADVASANDEIKKLAAQAAAEYAVSSYSETTDSSDTATASGAGPPPPADGLDKPKPSGPGAVAPSVSTSVRFREDSAMSVHAPVHLTEDRTYAYFDLNSDLWSSANGTYRISLSSSVRGFYDSVFDLTHLYSGQVRTNEEHQVDIRRAVLSFTGPGWTIHAGRQQIVWGEAVGLFVADVVNPKDYREFLIPDFDDVRIPLWGVDAEKSLGRAGKLELFWSPDERVSQLPVAGSEFTFFTPTSAIPSITTYEHIAHTLGNSRVGLRYSWLKNGWDSSLFYLHAIDDLPVTSTALSVNPNPIIEVTQRYPQVDNFAATTSKSLGDFVLKGEAIFTKGTGYETRDLGPAVRRDTVSGMLGFSYPLPQQYLLDVQYFQTSLIGNAVNLYQPGLRDGLSVRVADVASLRRFKPSLQAVYSVNQHDYWISPRLSMRIASPLFLTLGFDWFAGNPETQFGQFRDASRLELSLYWKAK